MPVGHAEAVVDARLQQAVLTSLGQVQVGLGEVRSDVRALDDKLDDHTAQEVRNFDRLHETLGKIDGVCRANQLELKGLATAAELAREHGREAGGEEGRKHGRRALYGAGGVTAGLLALAEILRGVGVLGGG